MAGSRERPLKARWQGLGSAKRLLIEVAAVVGALVAIATGIAAFTGGLRQAWDHFFDEPADFLRTPVLGLQVWQDGKQVDLVDGSTGERDLVVVELARDPFELWLPEAMAEDGLAVCAWTDDSVFDLAGGEHRDETRCLTGGSGIADYEHASGRLYLDREGFNYLVGERVQRASDEEFVRAYFARTLGPDGDAAVGAGGNSLYLTAFADDGDDVVEAGEFEYLRLDF